MAHDHILITAGPHQFLAVFEADAPKTVHLFRSLLPYQQKLIHVRWSGEGLWVPLGEQDFGIGFENHTSHPSAGHILLYPGGFSETELLFCYGGVAFASKMGSLAANHFLTIVEGNENLKALGNLVLWEGAQDVRFEIAGSERYIATLRVRRSVHADAWTGSKSSARGDPRAPWPSCDGFNVPIARSRCWLDHSS
jgi:hypothetical protein